MRKYKIYKITNLINLKLYIGQTIQELIERFYGHCGKTNNCKSLHGAIAKYGRENFKIELIEEVETIELANERESYYIDLYKSSCKDNGYNILTKGRNFDFTKDENYYIRRKEAAKKLWQNPEYREKITKARKKQWEDPKYIDFQKNLTKTMTLERKKEELFVYKSSTIKHHSRWNKQITKIGEFVGVWVNITTCAKELGLHKSSISNCLNPNSGTITSKGYMFFRTKQH